MYEKGLERRMKLREARKELGIMELPVRAVNIALIITRRHQYYKNIILETPGASVK